MNVGDAVTKTQEWGENPDWPRGMSKTGTVIAVDESTVDVDWGGSVECGIPIEEFEEE